MHEVANLAPVKKAEFLIAQNRANLSVMTVRFRVQRKFVVTNKKIFIFCNSISLDNFANLAVTPDNAVYFSPKNIAALEVLAQSEVVKPAARKTLNKIIKIIKEKIAKASQTVLGEAVINAVVAVSVEKLLEYILSLS